VWSPRVGESKGQESGQQNKYFKRKYLTFALKSFSIIEKKKKKEIQSNGMWLDFHGWYCEVTSARKNPTALPMFFLYDKIHTALSQNVTVASMGQTKTCKTSVCYSPSDDR
jgi:hypothetical protein